MPISRLTGDCYRSAAGGLGMDMIQSAPTRASLEAPGKSCQINARHILGGFHDGRMQVWILNHGLVIHEMQ